MYTEQGNVEAALSTYMEALEHSPDNPEILTTLGITFLRCCCCSHHAVAALSSGGCYMLIMYDPVMGMYVGCSACRAV